MMQGRILLLIAIVMLLVSGCIDSANRFDLSASRIQDLKFGDSFILTCHIPKDTSVNYYKIFEDSKRGYSIRSVDLTNSLGKTDFYIYELTSGRKSLEYLFGTSEEAYKAKALEEWNKKQLSTKGFDRDFHTIETTPMKEINGVKTARIIRTTATDLKGNKMIAESCWFAYSYAFWFMTSTWPEDYFEEWWTSDVIFHHQY